MQINSKIFRLLIYKQTPYETGRIASLATANDGNLGISFRFHRNKILKNLTFEIFDTSNQGLYRSNLAKFLNLNDPHFPEIENYYNNNTSGGWVYFNQAKGSPFILLDKDTKNGGGEIFSANFVKAFYFSGNGYINVKTKWNLRISKSRHGYLVDGNNFPVSRFLQNYSQFSFNAGLEKNLFESTTGTFQIGYDNGQVLKNSTSLLIGLKYKIN
jgi:hypothetical protein